MGASLRAKIGLKDEARAYVSGAPADVAEMLSAGPARLLKTMSGSFDFLLAFFQSEDDLDRHFQRLSGHLAARGALWVAWPKGGRNTDLSLPRIIEIGYRHGMVESKTIAVDAAWSAIKFTAPKPGKRYRNSYGQLASQRATERG
ncbi:MAG: DUF3052 family protein [Rubrivivax sp.]|nr:MAG: DUF3052 family protein [Rubrivivax sp.]